MTTCDPPSDRCLAHEVRDRTARRRDDGSVLLLILDPDGEIAHGVLIGEGAGVCDETFCHNLAHVIEESCPWGAVLAIVRRSGEVLACDLEQWERISARTDRVERVLVVGRQRHEVLWRAAVSR